MEIRRFNEGDWRSFSGAERFSNGEGPWILEGLPAVDDFPVSWWEEDEEKTVTVVADKNGIEVCSVDGGMYWSPSFSPSRDPEEMEIKDQMGRFILYLFSILKEVSYEKLIGIGFKEY